MLTHVKELIEQNHDKLMKMCPMCPCGLYSAGLNRKETHTRIIFAGIQSAVKNSEAFGRINLILIDECHLVSPKDTTSYQKFIRELKLVNPSLKVIGFSATPYRLGQGLITEGGLFTDICYDISKMERFNALISEGYLAPVFPKRVDAELDTSNVPVQGGEFVNKALQETVDRESITREALKEVVTLAENRKHWLIFATGIDHAEHIAHMLQKEMGISAAPVHSKIPDKVRTQRLTQFKNGEIKAITNNNVLTTGFDFPEIDLIVILRPTKSTSLHVQMIGRGTRPVYAPGFDLETTEGRLAAIAAGEKPKGCLVLDFAGNTRTLGPINDPVLPKPKGQKKGGGSAPVKICEQCGMYCHASARVCEYCGYEFPKSVHFGSQAGTEDIITTLPSPVIENFSVSKVYFHKHQKIGAPNSLKVVYMCGMRPFTKYVCLEHAGYAKQRAVEWWKRASGDSAMIVPETVEAALELAPTLQMPSSIKVHVNKKYPEIIDYDYQNRQSTHSAA